MSHTCDTCEKSFKRSEHLARHLLRHSGEKPYCCETCHRSFSRNDALKRHLKIHTSLPPYKIQKYRPIACKDILPVSPPASPQPSDSLMALAEVASNLSVIAIENLVN